MLSEISQSERQKPYDFTYIQNLKKIKKQKDSNTENRLIGTSERDAAGLGKGIKKYKLALAGVVQWIEHHPENQRVTGLIPSQGTCLGSGLGP